jgi:replicative DNA helicase
VAGRPGMGKTAFTLAVARNAAVLDNKVVAFFSLEMSTHQILQRLISMEAEIDQRKIQTGNLTPAEVEQITNKVGNLNKANLFIDDTAGLSVMDFRKKVRKIKREYGRLDLIIIDYLQLMTANMNDGKGKAITNREQEIAFISRSLKSLAKELQVPVIALAQLSRQTEQRTGSKGKRPMLSDLRESGSIEQDADMVIFLYREEYYNRENPVDENNNSLKGIAEIIIEKHRNGETGTVLARFIGQYVKYADFNDFGQYNQPLSSETPFDSKPDDFNNANSGGASTVTLPSKMNDDDFDDEFIKNEF